MDGHAVVIGATAFDTRTDMGVYRFGRRWPPFHTDLELVSGADLVVDCSGRGARSDRWLTGLGFPTPDQLEIKVGVARA